MIAILCRPKARHGRQNPAYRGVDCLRVCEGLVAIQDGGGARVEFQIRIAPLRYRIYEEACLNRLRLCSSPGICRSGLGP